MLGMLMRIRFILYAIYAAIMFFVVIAIAAVLSLFMKNKKAFFQSYARFCFRYIFIPPSGVKVRCHGLLNIPSNHPVVFVSNHQSNVDVPLLLAYLPGKFRFIAKKELFAIPLLGWYMRSAGYIQVERGKPSSAYSAIEQAVSAIREGDSLMIFPEGTRSWDGSLGDFKRGSLLAAQLSGAPIIPVAISGSFRIMPRKTLLIRPTEVKISVGDPVFIKDEEESEKKFLEVRAAILRML